MEDWQKTKKEFLELWTLEKVKNMTLEEYTNLDKSNSFAYWLESKTSNVVGIGGGSAYKFGIFKRQVDYEKKKLKSGQNGNNIYGWYEKYGDNQNDVFEKVKSLIIQTIQYSQDEEFHKIDDIDLGTAYKWKIAFMYAPKETLLRIVSKKAFEFLAKKYNINSKLISEIQKELIQLKPKEINFYDYSSRLWNEFQRKDNYEEEFNQQEIERNEEETFLKTETPISESIDYDFPHKNLLLKGVPGTGKSRAIENIINKKLNLKDHKKNILRINIHSASSNADLMQGIGISSKDGQVEYKEKQGLILNLIERATFKPHQPFVLILEEIQENSLNELIGDLIYLIEEDKRAENKIANYEEYKYQELVEKIIKANSQTSYVEIPYLVNDSTEYRKMIMPNNLYIFCTSNYRDDKKVIEDNLLRRFEVLEIYPKYKRIIGEAFKKQSISDFLERLNSNILEVMKDEIHPDRFLIGHSNWLNVDNKEKFYRAFLKVVVEFKDIKEVEFSDFRKIIDKNTYTHPEWIEIAKYNSYKELIEYLQNEAGYDFLND